MHLPPRVPTPATTTTTTTTTTIKAKELIMEGADKATPILPYTPTGPATTRAPSPGYFPTEPQPPLDTATPATAVPLMGPAGAKQQLQQQLVVEADKGEPILPFTPTGAEATRPPTPGYFPEQPRPTLSPAEAEAAQAAREQGQRQQGQGETRMADSVLVGPPAPVVVEPLPLPPQPMPAVAAVGGEPEPYVVVDPAVPQYEPAPLVQEAQPGVAAEGVYGQPVIAVVRSNTCVCLYH